MTLMPKEFNQLATKEGLNRVEIKVDLLTDNMSQLLTSVDGLTKKVVDI